LAATPTVASSAVIGLLVAETPNVTELCSTSFRLAGSPIVLTVQPRHAAASVRRQPIRWFHPAGHVMQPQERINGAGRVAARID
jgi:hypothetical protein